jgi:hypothetical protein
MNHPSSNGISARWTAFTAGWSLGLRCGLLATVTLAAWAIAAAWKYPQAGSTGIWAAGVAAAICLAGPLIALLLTAKFRSSPHAAVSGVLLGTLMRLGLPLAALVFFQEQGGPLVQAGVIGCILAIYPVTLLTSVALEVSLLQPR